jgi:chitinase
LIKANHSKGWDAKPPAYVARKRDRAAGLPGGRSTYENVLAIAGLTIPKGAVMKTIATRLPRRSRNLIVFSVLLAAILFSVMARAETVTLAWDPNTESDLAGYRLHYGTASRNYTQSVDAGNVTQHAINNLSAGQTYYFAATAYNTAGNESGYSAEVSHTLPAANQAPSVNAGADQTVSAGASVTLSGTGSDPDNGIASWQWRQTAGVSVTLTGAATQQACFTAPAISTGSLSLVFEFRATDAAGLSAADTCTVTVLSADMDGDGVPNEQDAFPNDPSRWQASGGVSTPDQDPGGPAPSSPANQAPPAPVLTAPATDEITDTLPVLQTALFSDPDSGDAHAETRWQVFRDEDSACVLDIRSNTALTRLTVPKLVLDEATAYFWRAQFVDSRGAASEWSNYGFFSTRNSGFDLNADGIPDAQEAGPTADLDGDGVKDYLQSHIKSLKMEGTRVQMGVSIKECPAALAIEYAESEDPKQPEAYATGKPRRMPFGLINFRIAVARPGDTATVKIHFSEAAPRNSRWFKYDPISGSWYDFSALARFASDRRSVTLTLTDGGNGDADGIANGVIVDPAGLVEIDDIVGGPSTSTTSSSGGGCFIDAAGSGRSLLSLLGLLSLAGLGAAGWAQKAKCP